MRTSRTFGLSPEQLQEIGRITLGWNRLEAFMQEFIWQLGDWDRRVGHLTTTELSAVALVGLASNFYKPTISDERLAEECSEAIWLFDNLRKRRNTVVHASVSSGANPAEPSLVRRSTKAAKGSVVKTVTSAEIAALRGASSDLVICEAAIDELSDKVFDYRFYRENHKAGDPTTLIAFVHREPEPSEQIARLRSRVAELRLQSDSQGSKKRPRPPSGQ